MRGERTYLVEFRKAGRGNRQSKVRLAKLTAMSVSQATELAKAAPELTGMKILSVYVDPKFWDSLKKKKKKK